MSYREKLQALQESLNVLQEEGFLYDLESLQIIYRAILTIIPGWIRDSPWLWQVQDVMGWQQFLEALEKLRASLSQVRPQLVLLRLVVLQRILQQLEEEEEEVGEWSPDPLADIMTVLEELAPGQLVSYLQHLIQVLQEIRPPGGFRTLATHSGVVARLGNYNFLTFLAKLEEVVDNKFLDPEIAQQLHFLHYFLHTLRCR